MGGSAGKHQLRFRGVGDGDEHSGFRQLGIEGSGLMTVQPVFNLI